MAGSVRVGCSGYQYRHWKGDFYPHDLRLRDWFGHYATQFDTVEINNSFYRLPEAEVFARWREAAPPGFLFAVKFSRYGTHMKKLKDPEEPIHRFVERGARLEEKLGPVLVHLPPRWHVEVERLDRFLSNAPRNMRWAVEVRDPSWLIDDVYDVLRRHGAALCLHDIIEPHPRVITTNWTYLRFHGQRYTGNYSAERLAAAAGEIREWLGQGLDVYAYFNNDIGGHAPRNARTLRALVHPG